MISDVVLFMMFEMSRVYVGGDGGAAGCSFIVAAILKMERAVIIRL